MTDLEHLQRIEKAAQNVISVANMITALNALYVAINGDAIQTLRAALTQFLPADAACQCEQLRTKCPVCCGREALEGTK